MSSLKIGSGKLPVEHETIAWINVDQVQCGHMATLRINELKRNCTLNTVGNFKHCCE